MANFADETLKVYDPQVLPYAKSRESDTHFSFLGEVGAYVNFKAHKHVEGVIPKDGLSL